MSSDASQSILRLTLLASATAAFMVVWTSDSSRTVGMTLAERNQQVVPAHALGRQPAAQLASRSVHRTQPVIEIKEPQVTHRASHSDLQSLPGGSYRVVFDDGRVEWLTVIDRNGELSSTAPAVISTTVHGERAHVIRVSERGLGETVR